MLAYFNTNGEIVAQANADVFVIPNHAAKISSYLEYYRDGAREEAKNLLALNGSEFDERDFWNVECWLTSSEELNSDNLQDHGFIFEIDDDDYFVHPGSISRDIPKQLLPRDEGATSVIRYRLKAYKMPKVRGQYIENNEYTLNLTLFVTGAQTKYRYARFGKFGNVVEYVCR